jgi:hypothetical protein
LGPNRKKNEFGSTTLLQADLEAAEADCQAEQNLGPYIWSESGTDFGSLMKKQQQQQPTAQPLTGAVAEALAMKCK